MMLTGHAVHVVIVDRARHAALCDCGWMSETTTDVAVSADEMADHLLGVVLAVAFPDRTL